MLDKCDGPACPRCGCRDSDIRVEPRKSQVSPELIAQFGVNSWFAGGRARCKYCGLVFSFRELPTAEPEAETDERPDEPEPVPMHVDVLLPEPVVAGIAPRTYPVRVCPECDSREVKVTSTRRPVRHHKCGSCGAKFKSIELDHAGSS